jgi:hypothetical protein
VQLHVVEELWQMLQGQVTEEDNSSEEINALWLSQAAVSGKAAPKTMQFVGHIQGMDLLVLLDSGSSHSFLSTQVADHVTGLSMLPKALSVRVANGSLLSCTQELLGAAWSLSGYEFKSNLRVLPLQTYDLIIGMDWLEMFSPMLVHWADKWLVIPYEKTCLKLYGLQSSKGQCSVIELCQLQDLPEKDQSIIAGLSVELQSLVQKFQSVFALPTGLPPQRDCDHHIQLLPGAHPFHIRPYRYAPALKTEIEQQVEEMLSSGIIQRSQSEFSSPVILVKKKDSTYRFCVDYRHLNALTVKTRFPVPVIDELLDELNGLAWFSTLDLRAGFHQIRMAPQDQHKTAFQTHHGQFEFRVMSFGLTGAPATFQGAMNKTLASLLRTCVLVFFDDILVYSPTWESHLQHLEEVLHLLSRDRWQVKLSKCSFGRQQIAYLGHIISQAGVSTDPSKVATVVSWPVPTTCKELRGFLGLAGYYRKFVKNFGIVAKPLTDLLKKNSVFVWTSTHDTAFQTLKQALSSAPVLALPNFTKPLSIETDASDKGIGAVLQQEGHPLAFVSKALGAASL